MHSVLFICTANICRSPMAVGLWKAKIGSAAVDWRIASAGTWARDGEPAANRTQLILKEKGIDLATHRSRTVTRELLSTYKLILTMEHGHKEALRAEFPEIAPRVYLLSEMIDKNFDVQDPIGGSMADFRDTAREIEGIFTQGFKKIYELSEE